LAAVKQRMAECGMWIAQYKFGACRGSAPGERRALPKPTELDHVGQLWNTAECANQVSQFVKGFQSQNKLIVGMSPC
jgi:hypothetical protein